MIARQDRADYEEIAVGTPNLTADEVFAHEDTPSRRDFGWSLRL